MPRPARFRLLLVLLLLACSAGCELLYEEPEEEPEEVFMIVDKMPLMIPNQTEGMRQLGQCIVYPKAAREARIEGRVFVQFVVDTKGRVVDPEVVHGLGYGTDEEAVRCVRQLRFTPGRTGEEVVRVKMSLPVTFRLR